MRGVNQINVICVVLCARASLVCMQRTAHGLLWAELQQHGASG